MPSQDLAFKKSDYDICDIVKLISNMSKYTLLMYFFDKMWFIIYVRGRCRIDITNVSNIIWVYNFFLLTFRKCFYEKYYMCNDCGRFKKITIELTMDESTNHVNQLLSLLKN